MNGNVGLILPMLFPPGPKLGSRLWLPSDLATLVFWVKADAITGLANNDLISTWTDLSGAGNDATAAGAARPIYKTAILNGLAVARFNFSQRIATSNFARTQPTTIFMVGKQTNSAVRAMMDSAGTANAGEFEERNSTTLWLRAGSQIALTVTDMANYAVVVGVCNGASSLLSYNGTTGTGNAGSTQGAGVTLGSIAGGGYNMEGDIAEAGAFAAGLATAERQKLEGYLAWKYGLQASLAAGHPYLAAPPMFP